MLVLSRKKHEVVVIGEDIEVTVLEVHGDRVKLGFRGPTDVPIYRAEVEQKLGECPPALHHVECS